MPGDLVAERQKLEADAREAARIEKQCREDMKAIDAELMERMNALGVESIKAGGQSITAFNDRKPVVEDWEAFYEHIVKNAEPFLLQRRIVMKSAIEYENVFGKPLPGVRMEDVPAIRFRKA